MRIPDRARTISKVPPADAAGAGAGAGAGASVCTSSAKTGRGSASTAVHASTSLGRREELDAGIASLACFVFLGARERGARRGMWRLLGSGWARRGRRGRRRATRRLTPRRPFRRRRGHGCRPGCCQRPDSVSAARRPAVSGASTCCTTRPTAEPAERLARRTTSARTVPAPWTARAGRPSAATSARSCATTLPTAERVA